MAGRRWILWEMSPKLDKVIWEAAAQNSSSGEMHNIQGSFKIYKVWIGILLAAFWATALFAWYNSSLFIEYRLERACKRKNVEDVLQFTSNSNPEIRIKAIDCIAKSHNSRYARKLSSLLNDPYITVRFAAIHALGCLQGEEPVNELCPLLRHPEKAIRVAAYREIVNLLQLTVPRESLLEGPSQLELELIDSARAGFGLHH
jgi:hypothetical protein